MCKLTKRAEQRLRNKTLRLNPSATESDIQAEIKRVNKILFERHNESTTNAMEALLRQSQIKNCKLILEEIEG